MGFGSAAVASAAVSRGPRIADYLLGRLLLAGCVSLGMVSFIAIGWSNATGTFGVQQGAGLAVSSLLWLGVGVPRVDRQQPRRLGAAMIGLALAGLVPVLIAAITGALQRRFAARARPELPAARMVE